MAYIESGNIALSRRNGFVRIEHQFRGDSMGKSESEGTADEDIGRPGPWSEGRYEKPGQSVDDSVRTPPRTVPNADTRLSTPVTRKDYESPETMGSKDGSKDKSDAGGDTG
jgi:hypothetical protein